MKNLYEELKRVMRELNLTPEQYERGVREIARILRV